MTVLEFWPDYGPGPLWSNDGQAVDLQSLGIGQDLVDRLTAWNATYSEDKVPVEGLGDVGWVSEGRRLLEQVRGRLGDQ